MIACKLPKEALPPPRTPPRSPPPRSPPPLLPAARTGIAPCDHAYSMPAVIGAEIPPVPPRSGSELPSPRLRLTTWAPWSTTHMMPACTSASAPAPLASSALATMSFAPGATPAMPLPLSFTAAMRPATWVPCPLSSCPDPVHRDGSALAPMQFVVVRIWPARSSWLRSTPVSTMPTLTPAPVLVAQADGAPICVRPHCWEKSGSFDANAVLGSAMARAHPTTTALAVNRRRGRSRAEELTDDPRRATLPALALRRIRPPVWTCCVLMDCTSALPKPTNYDLLTRITKPLIKTHAPDARNFREGVHTCSTERAGGTASVW